MATVEIRELIKPETGEKFYPYAHLNGVKGAELLPRIGGSVQTTLPTPIFQVKDALNAQFYPQTHAEAVIGLAQMIESNQFFVKESDGNGGFRIKLKDEFTGFYANGWAAAGGVGTGGGGGGIITSVYGATDLGSVYSIGGTEDFTKTFSAFAIDRIWQSVVALQQSTPNVSLSNGSACSTLAVNGTVADFYTKTQVDSLLGAINAFDYVIASSLPTASADTMYKIYLIPSADPQTGNVKDEYITIRSGSAGSYTYSWEQIGSTSIDLSGYATQTWANQQFLKKTGGELTGDLWLHTGSANYGSKLFFGDKGSGAGFVYLHEDTDDHLVIHAESGISLTTGQSGSVTIDGAELKPGEYVTLSDAQTVTGIKTFTNSLYGKTVASNTDPNWYIDNDGSASFDNLQVGGTGVVTIANAQEITGAKTFSGGIVMGGSNIIPSADLGSALGYSNRRFSDINARTLSIKEINFKNSDNNAKTGYLSFGDGWAKLRFGSNVDSSYKQINLHETYGLYPENGSSVNLGYYSSTDNRYRWANIYGVNEDLSGNLNVGGTISVNSINSIDQSNSGMSLFNYGARATKSFDAYGTSITLRAHNAQGTQINLLGVTAYGIVVNSTIRPNDIAGLNLGANNANGRWANIYGVNADLTGNLALASSSHIDIGPARIEYDSDNGAIHITTSQTGNNAPTIGFYVDGFNSAGGIGAQSGSVKYVNCATQSEYNAIANKSASTIYTIGSPVTKIYLGTIQLYTES